MRILLARLIVTVVHGLRRPRGLRFRASDPRFTTAKRLIVTVYEKDFEKSCYFVTLVIVLQCQLCSCEPSLLT